MYTYLMILLPILVFLLMGIKIVRPTQRGLIERLGKYSSFAGPGFHWIIPFKEMYVREYIKLPIRS